MTTVGKRPPSNLSPALDAALADILRNFHRNSCYPEAMDGELNLYLDKISEALLKYGN